MGRRGVTVRPVILGTLVHVHTHRIALDGDVVRKVYVSWDRDEPDREWAGLTALARHVPDLGPTPLSRGREAGAPVIVMSRVPGAPLGSSRMTNAQVEALAEALRRLFSAPVDPGTPERAFGPSVLRSAVRDWASEDHDLADCVDPTLVGDALTIARDWLVADDRDTDRISDPVLAIGDGNLANVMWDGRVCRLIDFEEFGQSDLAYEVADVVEHASSRLDRLLDVDAFLLRMGLDDAQQARLVAFRRLLACFWLVMLLPGNAGFTRNPPGSTEDQAHHLTALLHA